MARGRRSEHAEARIVDGLLRGLTLGALALVIVYPVRTFLGLSDLPVWLRLLWPVLVVTAGLAPWPSLLGFLLAAPLLPIWPRELGWPRVSLAELWLFALLVPAWLRVALGRVRRVDLPGSAWLLLALATVSLAVTLYPFHLARDGVSELVGELHQFAMVDYVVTTSQNHVYAPIVSWAILAEGLALLWLVVLTLHTEGRARVVPLLIVTSLAASFVAGYGIVQRWTGRNLLAFWAHQDPWIVRINATFTDVNSLGAYLTLMLWIAIAVAAVREGTLWRWSWRVGAAAIAVALVFTASRAALAGAAIGGLVVMMGLRGSGLIDVSRLTGARQLRILRASPVIALVLAAALVGYATVRDVRLIDQDSYLDGVLYTLNLRTPSAERLKGRMPLWAAGARMVADRPVFGIGTGRFYKQLWAYAPDREALIRAQENAHNYFLQIAAELGVTGLLAFSLLLSAGLRGAWRAARGTGPPRLRGMALAVGAGIVGYVFTLLVGHPLLLREGQFALWPIVGAALFLGTGKGEPPGHQPDRSVPAGRLAPVWVWALCGLVLVTLPIRAAQEAARVDLSRLSFGLHDPETSPSGRPFRWSGGRAAIHVPASAQTFTLPMRTLAPFPQTVTVLLNGQTVDEIRLSDYAWHNFRYLLPRREGGPIYHRIELRIEPTWTPEWEGRTLGVMVGEYGWG